MAVYYVNFNSQVSALTSQVVRYRASVSHEVAVVSRKRLLISMFALFCVLATQLSLRLVITDKGYEIERMRMIALNNDSDLRDLRLMYAYQTRPTEVIKLAEQRLGMVPLQPSQIRKVAY